MRTATVTEDSVRSPGLPARGQKQPGPAGRMQYMRAWVCLAATAALALAARECRGQLTLSPRSGGSCVSYPAAGGYCSSVGFGGASVFLYDGTTFAESDASIEAEFSGLESAAQTSSTPECLSDFRSIICAGWYPLCDGSDMPRRPCKTWCQEVHANSCETTFDLARSAGLGNLVFACDDAIGDAARLLSIMYANFLGAWDGEPQFLPAAYSDTVNGVTREVECLDGVVGGVVACEAPQCNFPMLEQRYPLVVSPDSNVYAVPEDEAFCFDSSSAEGNNNDTLDCARCQSRCEVPCPYPLLYDDGVYTVLWLSTWLPGLVALPLNVIVLVGEWVKLKKSRDITDRNVLFASVFSITLFFIDTLPAMAIKNIRCGGHPTLSDYANVYGPAFCKLGLLKVNVLQALMFASTCSLYKVRKQIAAAGAMSTYEAGHSAQLANLGLVFVAPCILAVTSLFMQTDQLYEASTRYRLSVGGPFNGEFLYVGNNIRYMHSCGPLFASATEELVVVQLPLLLGGAACAALSVSLIGTVYGLARSDWALASNAKSRTRGHTGLVKLAASVLRFAAIAVALVVVNAVATLMYVPTAGALGTELGNFLNCIETGINLVATETDGFGGTTRAKTAEEVYALCGDIRDKAPSVGLLLMLNLANSLPPLGFGFVFAFPAVSRLLGLLKAGHCRVRSTRVLPAPPVDTQ